MTRPSITKLQDQFHGSYTTIAFPGEDFPVPLKLTSFDMIDSDFIEDVLYDALETHIAESSGGYKWKNKNITPFAVIGLYSLHFDEEGLPSDSDNFQCMGMLFITDSGNIIRWDGDHYVTDFTDDCEIIGNEVELSEWIQAK